VKSTIIVGISLIFASTSCILGFALIDPSTHIGAIFFPIAWLIYLGFGFYVMSPLEKDNQSSDKPLHKEEET